MNECRCIKKGEVPPLRPSWLARVLWLTEAVIARFDMSFNCAWGQRDCSPRTPRYHMIRADICTASHSHNIPIVVLAIGHLITPTITHTQDHSSSLVLSP